ncbi:hypothetical protein H257_12680 [Aphanomyces astaci]|uniref:Uncharacterized protein n=1 Tax=Aphanomyces astaci TaxID=112090 RepID=W4FXH6_APHAT|nr:hypothetical protein H257_12680 [Aphanomyces astaci]ETV72205.1 hypothetical protein H257_12680 [Aphanomyces astaci]|eukprot:XP_009838273.1 hypothetical protein H257_12680 [Aphanomyces astaci]
MYHQLCSTVVGSTVMGEIVMVKNVMGARVVRPLVVVSFGRFLTLCIMQLTCIATIFLGVKGLDTMRLPQSVTFVDKAPFRPLLPYPHAASMDHGEPLPLTPRGQTGMVLHRILSQEDVYAQPIDIPVAQYPPDMAVRHLGQQVRQAVDAQGARINSVQQAVGGQTQQTYEQLMVLHQQQQLTAQRATSEHHAQGLRAAAVASVQHSDAFEEMPAYQCPMTCFHRDPVPKAPAFNGSTKVQKRRLMDQYESYRREIALANAQRPGGQQIMQMPLTACMDPLSVERIAYWEIGKASHELTEEDWRNCFLGARECDPVDMTKLCQNMAKLKMDGSIQSAESQARERL